jgi:AbrB family looped-hinge helix DNA binding protein
MPTATLTSKGQITIPIEVREDMGLRTGTQVDFVRQGDGYVIVPISHSIARLAGFFGKYDGPTVSVGQMNDDIATEMGRMP